LVAATLGATHNGYELEQQLVTRVPQADGSFRERRQGFTVSIAGTKARLCYETGEHVIVRLDRGEVIQLDILLRNYKKKTFDDLRAAWEIANEMYLEQIEGAPLAHPRRADLIDELTDGPQKWAEIWKLPPGDGRSRLIAKYRLPEEPPVIEVRKAAETKKVCDTNTQRYESLENGKPMAWAYLARSLPFDTRYFEFMELQRWILPELSAKLRERRMRKAGMPLETVMKTRGGAEVRVVTKSVRAAQLEDGLFEVPTSYKEQKSKSSFK
jgi:hypothetical protein